MLNLSPDVNTIENDLITSAQEKTNNVAAIAGAYQWGPVDVPTLITGGEDEFVTKFGIPDNSTHKYVMPLLDFFSYSNAAIVVRQVGAAALNAFPTGGTPELIKNDNAAEQAVLTGVDFYARYPGTAGNGIQVSICDSANFTTWQYANQFSYEPLAGEFSVIVVDTTGYWTGIVGGVMEKFEILQNDATAFAADGTPKYWFDVINGSSKYVRCGDKSVILSKRDVVLAGGADDQVVDITNGLQLLKNREAYDLQFLIVPAVTTAEQKAAIDVAEYRGDCTPFIAPALADVVNNSGSERDSVKAWRIGLNADSTYAGAVDNWGYMYDKYNRVYRWVPATGGTAGLFAKGFKERDPWKPVAGLNHGKYRNYIKMAWSASKEDRDVLYPLGVNSIVTFPAEGIVLYGDKTMTKRPTVYSHFNVRWAFIIARTSIADLARYFLFELNNEFTRAQFLNAARPILRDMKNREAFEDFQLICNEDINNSDVRKQNKMIAKLMIKPMYSINWITLELSPVDGSYVFSEIQ